MNKCEMFVCEYLSTCIIGIACDNGNRRVCKHNQCNICAMRKRCKNENVHSKGEEKNEQMQTVCWSILRGRKLSYCKP